MGPVLSARVDESGDTVRGLGGVFVFPDPNRLPAKSVQSLIGIGIPGSIGFDLIPPEIGVALRPGSMLGATVPEASIYKHSQPCSGEYNVGRASGLRQERDVEAIA